MIELSVRSSDEMQTRTGPRLMMNDVGKFSAPSLVDVACSDCRWLSLVSIIEIENVVLDVKDF